MYIEHTVYSPQNQFLPFKVLPHHGRNQDLSKGVRVEIVDLHKAEIRYK